ncbi:deoxyribodipyrimidine photo-lyase [Candidatus Woesebacteria bacterium]|nr:deoxyribodipyrimidine photo-lyase [Candidatus Woesebacteria bacterium]
MNLQRVYKINGKSEVADKAVAYWMSRDQRVAHNWALIYAAEKAQQYNMPLYVFFALTPSFLGATWRQYDFMIRGLQEVEEQLRALGIGFEIVLQNPVEGIPALVKKYDIGSLVCDFSPLRIGREWRKVIGKKIPVALYEVDAHNIVPCRVVTQKKEYAARTIRPKIHALLDIFMDSFPDMTVYAGKIVSKITDWEYVYQKLPCDRSVKPVDWLSPGSEAAHKLLNDFILHRLETYNDIRNNPALDGQSGLSPYLHFGHISAQYVAQEILRSSVSQRAKDVYLEELIIRRELSDNYCYYNPQYDSFEGFPQWAQKTLEKHILDKRPFLYSDTEFEEARTHDLVWNLAQSQMVTQGKMHGYLRMYWAKKILEWSSNPQEAMRIAIYLNDKYELDGRDPNGYVGIAWSIGGVHDRPWFEREIFGLVRYMSSTKIQRMLKSVQ